MESNTLFVKISREKVLTKHQEERKWRTILRASSLLRNFVSFELDLDGGDLFTKIKLRFSS